MKIKPEKLHTHLSNFIKLMMNTALYIIQLIKSERFWVVIAAVATAVMSMLTYIIIRQNRKFFDISRSESYLLHQAYVSVEGLIKYNIYSHQFSFTIKNYGDTPANNVFFLLYTEKEHNKIILIPTTTIGALVPSQSHSEVPIVKEFDKEVISGTHWATLSIYYKTYVDECKRLNYTMEMSTSSSPRLQSVEPLEC